jgi:ArsR family transcriptional regulator, virulence genes transcriptional regulator
MARPLKVQVSDFQAMEAKAEEVAIMLSALANPVRLLLLCLLVQGEASVGAMVDASQISQSAVSQHLAKMRDLKLVATRREGQMIFYRLANQDVQRILTVLHDIYCR